MLPKGKKLRVSGRIHSTYLGEPYCEILVGSRGQVRCLVDPDSTRGRLLYPGNEVTIVGVYDGEAVRGRIVEG